MLRFGEVRVKSEDYGQLQGLRLLAKGESNDEWSPLDDLNRPSHPDLQYA